MLLETEGFYWRFLVSAGFNSNSVKSSKSSTPAVESSGFSLYLFLFLLSYEGSGPKVGLNIGLVLGLFEAWLLFNIIW